MAHARSAFRHLFRTRVHRSPYAGKRATVRFRNQIPHYSRYHLRLLRRKRTHAAQQGRYDDSLQGDAREFRGARLFVLKFQKRAAVDGILWLHHGRRAYVDHAPAYREEKPGETYGRVHHWLVRGMPPATFRDISWHRFAQASRPFLSPLCSCSLFWTAGLIFSDGQFVLDFDIEADESSVHVEETPVEDSRDASREFCEHYGLSPRESGVCEMWLTGHGLKYIQENLFIFRSDRENARAQYLPQNATRIIVLKSSPSTKRDWKNKSLESACMFELRRWREPTPIFNGSGHSARKKRSPQAFPIAGTLADYYPNLKSD